MPVMAPAHAKPRAAAPEPSGPVVLQRKCACSGSKDDERTIQRSALDDGTRERGSHDVRDVLRSSGQPLEPRTRGLMERVFGYDFGEVRVHADAAAARSARAVNASAYTVG